MPDKVSSRGLALYRQPQASLNHLKNWRLSGIPQVHIVPARFVSLSKFGPREHLWCLYIRASLLSKTRRKNG